MTDETVIEKPETGLVQAVADVMTKVERVAKGGRNEFGQYKFASVDDIKDSIRPLLGAAGLAVHMTEAQPVETYQMDSKAGKTMVAKFVFAITLSHVSGEAGTPEQSTVVLPFTGAQTSGIARSYALKEWLKSRFVMSTGEKEPDADAQKEDDYTVPPPPPSRPNIQGGTGLAPPPPRSVPPQQRRAPPPPPPDVPDRGKSLDNMVLDLRATLDEYSDTKAHLNDWKLLERENLDQLPPAERGQIEKAWNKAMEKF